MDREVIKRTLERILSNLADKDTLIKQSMNQDFGEYLDINEVNGIYSLISKTFGDGNALLIGGTALQRYSKHRPKDIDIMVNSIPEDRLKKLEKAGFNGIKKETFKPFFNPEMYSMRYGDKNIEVEIYSTKGLLSKNGSYGDLIKKARYDNFNGSKIYYLDPYNLAKLKYLSWKNRLFNGRSDKDIIELREAGIDDYIKNLNEKEAKKILKAYKPSVISHTKSVLSECLRLAYREFIHKNNY